LEEPVAVLLLFTLVAEFVLGMVSVALVALCTAFIAAATVGEWAEEGGGADVDEGTAPL
jgi:hypothetical protein